MAVSPTYPGVYVQEVPSGVHTIVGVSTSITLFVGRAASGPMLKAVRINTYADFLRTFGDDAGTVSAMARYVRLFFLNGGTDCYVIRIASGWAKSSVTLKSDVSGGTDVLTLTAKNPGALGDLLRAAVTYNTAAPDATFNLEVFRWQISPTGTKTKTEREEFLNLSMDPASPNYAATTLQQKSKLVDATAALGLTAIAGYSVSIEPIERATHTDLATWWNGLVSGGKNKFKISIAGKKTVTATVASVPAAQADWIASRNNIATAITTAITTALTNEGVTGLSTPPVVVSVLAGPTPVAVAPAETTLFRITAGAPTAGQDVRVTSADTNDIAMTLGLGLSNGGIEVGAWATVRPAPTAITLRTHTGLGPAGAISTANLVAFSSANKSDLTSIRLDELDPTTGTLVPKLIPLSLGGATHVWVDSATPPSNTGLLETLGKIRDAVNTYQASNPTSFFWKAELWGYRLAFLNNSGDDNATVTSPGFTFQPDPGAGATMAARFLLDVRYFTFGSGGIGGAQSPGTPGADGIAPAAADYTSAYNVARSDIDLFNLLVLPPDAAPAPGATLKDLWGEASALCNEERAFLIMDPEPSWNDTQTASTGVNLLRIGLTKDHSAVYFPRVKIVENGREYIIGPAGAMAGLYARTDANRGVWKAPAGTEADVRGVLGVDVLMSDLQNGAINPMGVNAIRLFPEGVISWGARTMDGADAFASEYKYISIRRLALFIEESLYRGLKWAVFEPNDEPLWGSIRLNVGAFMHDLFRKGAFAGGRPSDAYFVKCDKETTTANDQNLGIVNIWVGFAPLKPAEFVVLYLQQIAQAIPT
ncbi:MAG: phage tail sheath family protein [Deltaproteobacteria bacterium]|nr:MAG: phage tail sheath family protein [Deltaproteobacteria bacterium]TMQ16549.1 MAG: phage tail sheath family protein [Deltaproteobacteria bacterium]